MTRPDDIDYITGDLESDGREVHREEITWADRGEADGRREARTLHEEQPELGLERWVRLTDVVEAGGELGWDEGARQAGTAEIVGCPPEHRDEYYAGYARGGLAEAREIRREIEAAAQARTEERWWAWRDADYSRHYPSMEEAEAACAEWVRGESDTGPSASEEA